MGICKPIGLLATKQERLFFPAKLIIRGGLIMDKIKILKALSDNTRLSILNLLNGEKLCVCEIEAILDNTQSNI